MRALRRSENRACRRGRQARSRGSRAQTEPGDDRVVVRDVWRGTGQGPDADMEFTRVVTVRERKIVGIDIFWDHAEALEAAGLSE